MPKESKPRSVKADGPAKAARKTKAKKAKDPNAPKRPLSAYMYFSKDKREEVKNEHPTAKFGELGKLLGAKWSELEEEAKAPYIEQAAADKKRYEAEVAAYTPKDEPKEEEEKKSDAEEEEAE